MTATVSAMLLLLPVGETLRRLPRVVVGLVLFGVGVAMMLAAGLGAAPWDVFHQGLSELTGISVGTIIVAVGALIVLGFLPLGERIGVGTVLNALIIGPTVDLTLGFFQTPTHGVVRALLMLGGPVVIAVGSGLYIGGGLGPGPRDGIMTGLARRGIHVSRARTGIEVTVLLIGLLLGGSAGLGTLWFALGIGPLIGLVLPRLDRRGCADPPPPLTDPR